MQNNRTNLTSASPNSAAAAMQPLPPNRPNTTRITTASNASPMAMARAVSEILERMHAEFSHSLPVGIAQQKQLQRWTEALTLRGLDADSLLWCYNRACDTRRQKGISSFMPTVHDLILEYEKAAAEIEHGTAVDAEIRQRREEAQRWSAEKAQGDDGEHPLDVLQRRLG